MIGLTGAHRTGKTTLAKDWAKRSDIKYLTISASDVLARQGVEPHDITTISKRLEVQRLLVQECDRVFVGQREAFITDRTPLDVAAYTMADMTQHAGGADDWKAARSIVDDCLDITNSSFGAIVHLAPGIPFVAEKGKPRENAAYQEHIHLLISGLLAETAQRTAYWIFGRGVTDHDRRLEELDDIYDAFLEQSVFECEGTEYLQ